MGCGGSRMVGGGRHLRPLFLHQRHRSPPKLTMYESDEDSQKYRTPLSGENNGVFGQKLNEEKLGTISKVEIEACFRKNIQTGSRDESEFEDALSDAYEDDDEDKDRMRMIGHEHDDGAFPGSPTFRYFCGDGDGDRNGDDLGKIYAISSDNDDDTASPKENCNDENKRVKRGKKIKSIKKVLPKGGQAAVKKLLNMKLRYAQSSSTRHHHQSHLLVAKA